jgi:hypothetical protein
VADHDENTKTERRRPDLLTLLAGIATLLMSAYVLSDGHDWLPAFDPRWLLAGGALLVGLLLLGSSVRRRNR